MRYLFKKKKVATELVAVVSGERISLEKVEDPIFSERMMGDGLAFLPSGNTVVAPCDGTIVMIAQTKHAFGLKTEKGVEILIHVGMDTSSLGGEGFNVLYKQGDFVKTGTTILEFDHELLNAKGVSLITPVVILNSKDVDYKFVETSDVVQAGIDVIMQLY